jgi:hypothetical protein
LGPGRWVLEEVAAPLCHVARPRKSFSNRRVAGGAASAAALDALHPYRQFGKNTCRQEEREWSWVYPEWRRIPIGSRHRPGEDSPAYEAIKPMWHASAHSRIFIAEGVAPQ